MLTLWRWCHVNTVEMGSCGHCVYKLETSLEVEQSNTVRGLPGCSEDSADAVTGPQTL